MNTPPALTIDSVSYAYRSNWLGKPFSALKDVSLSIAAGEVFGFLGHNGAGKTTTIKCILGLIKPSRGTISIFGVPNYRLAARASLGYLPEHPYFYSYLTVTETMQLCASLVGLPREQHAEEIEQALDLVRVSARSKAPMQTLSKGLTQRVAMAQAIIGRPKILVLDEPFSGLDPLGRRDFRELFLHLKNLGTTLFLSSHILSDVEFLCDRASIMAHGELKGVYTLSSLTEGAPQRYELVFSPMPDEPSEIAGTAASTDVQDRHARAIYDSRETAEKALHTALTHGVPVHSFQAVRPSLEELFVSQVRFSEETEG